jgi:hypothetical protein
MLATGILSPLEIKLTLTQPDFVETQSALGESLETGDKVFCTLVDVISSFTSSGLAEFGVLSKPLVLVLCM